MYVDRMFIIFPFEEEFYRKWDIPVKYVGNPLFDELKKKMERLPSREELESELQLDSRPVIAILAGSRKHEVEDILPTMVNAVNDFPDHQFVLAGVNNLSDSLYKKILGNTPVKLVKNRTYELLSIAEAAIVTSGTATLETALIGAPQVVCYKTDPISLFIGWLVIKVKYISLVNLIADKEVVKELIGTKMNTKNLKEELAAIIVGGPKRDKIIEGYKLVKERLGEAGASARIAGEIVK